MKSSNWNIFSVTGPLCAGNSPVTGEFPSQRPVPRSFDVFFDLRPNKRLSKQSWGWRFETPSRSLWRHYCATLTYHQWFCVIHSQDSNFLGITHDINQWDEFYNYIFIIADASPWMVTHISVNELDYYWHRTGDKPLNQSIFTYFELDH